MFGAKMLRRAKFAGKYEFPAIQRTCEYDAQLLPVSYDKIRPGTDDPRRWVHFYVHDRRFLPIYRNPERLLGKLRHYAGVIGIDNSMYRDLPLARQIYSVYLNRMLDHYLLENGVNLIPNVSWGDWRSFDFCFDGIPLHATVAVSSHGSVRDPIAREYFLDGFRVMLNRIRPARIVHYGTILPLVRQWCCRRKIELVEIPTRIAEAHSAKGAE